MKRIYGLVSPTYTPMHEDETIALERIAPFVEYLIGHKFAGLFVLGSTGEFTSLSTAERKLVTEEYIKSAAGRLPVIINAGSCSYNEVIELVDHAVLHGADAVCMVAPFYFRPHTPRDLANFVKKIAPACQGLPLFLYYVPGITGVTMPMGEFVKIMIDEVPNFAGLKFTNENLCEFQRCVDQSEDIQILAGRDEMLPAFLAMGATAAVGTTFNYLPRLYTAVIEKFNNGNLEEARKLMTVSHRTIAVSSRYGLAALKTFMKFAGHDLGPMRSPVTPISKEQEKKFRQELEDANIMNWVG